MKYLHKAIASSTLPQYSYSPAFMERLLAAIHEEGAEIERSPNMSGIKLVDNSEITADSLEYFVTNKKSLEDEFLSDITKAIGKQDAETFCEVISCDWYDGRKLRDGQRVRMLKASILEYLIVRIGNKNKIESVVQHSKLPANTKPLLSAQQISAILNVNDQMMYRHIEEWKSCHTNADLITTDDIFLRRGLALDEELDTTIPYKEWDYLNSYSIAFSAPEKFSQMAKSKIPAIINGDLGLFSKRMLFFSPFIPGMDIGQFEAGIIPSKKALPLHFQGSHGGIQEYIIDPMPTQSDFQL